MNTTASVKDIILNLTKLKPTWSDFVATIQSLPECEILLKDTQSLVIYDRVEDQNVFITKSGTLTWSK